VDDEETIRDIGAKMLKELGFTPLVAKDGQEAVDIFKETPDIAFVILDLTMPHMDGEQCFRELRQLAPKVKVIMSSGYNEQDIAGKFASKGLSGFIQKPYNLSALRDSIKRFIF
jgi:CheY-like chemotaxis protein